MRARMSRLTWKLLLYLVVAVLLGGLTRDRLLTGLLTAGFVFGDSSVAVLLRSTKAADGGRRAVGTPERRAAGAGSPPGTSPYDAARRWP